jgi:hypothetical protein
MGVAYIDTGATFARAFTSLSLPSLDGLIGEYVLRGDQASSIVNRADPSNPLTVVGTPVYNASNVLVSSNSFGSHGFDTGIIPPVNCTIILISKPGSRMGIMGAETQAFGFLEATTGRVDFYNSQTGPVGNVADLAEPAHTTPYFRAGSGTMLGFGKLYVGTAGVISSATGEVAGLGRSSTTIKIGTSWYATTSAQREVHYAAIYNRILSDAEITAAYQSLKSYFSYEYNLDIS